MSGIFEAGGSVFGLSRELLLNVAGTVVLAVVWMVILRLVRRVISRTVEDPASRFQMNRISAYGVGIVAIVLLGRMWIQGIGGIATYFGLLSAGIAIALQDPLTNLAGWVFILVRQPFKIGDRIQLGTFSGDVVDIRLFRFVMLEIGNWVHADQSTGRVLHVPNGLVFKNPVANYDEAFGCIWNELEVTVTFESNWRRAKGVLEGIGNANAGELEPSIRKRIATASESMHIQFSKLTPVVWTTVVDSGVKLTLRYLCKPRERRVSASVIWEQVLDSFSDMPDVDLAYPTTRRFDRATEGKTSEHQADLRHRPPPSNDEPRA